MTRPRTEVLHDALAHLDVLVNYATGDLTDQIVMDAICMRLSAAIETLATLPQADRTELFDEKWPQMWGMRNRIAHGYLLVSSAMIRRTGEDDISQLVAAIQRDLAPGR